MYRAARSRLYHLGAVLIVQGPATDRQVWVSTAVASIVFGLTVPIANVLPHIASVLFLAQAFAVGGPALHWGRRGAWGGALLSWATFAAGDLANSIMAHAPSALGWDLALTALTGAILAQILGLMGEAVQQQHGLAERAQASEHRYNELFDSLPPGLLLLTESGTIELVNHSATQLLGRPVQQLIGASIRDWVAAEDWPELASYVADARVGLPIRVRLTGSRTTVLRTEWVFSAHGGDGRKQTLAVFWDAEEMIRRAEETSTLAAAVHCLREGVVLADLHARIRFANPAAAQIYGYSQATAMTGKLVAEHVVPERRDGFEKRIGQAGTADWSGETELLRANGDRVPVHITASPVRVDGQVIGSIGVITDLTESKAIEHRAATADKLATLGRLVAGAAHEINNPLAAVLANAELLQIGEAAPRQVVREMLDVIIQETRRAGRIVRDLLSFARQQPVARTEVNLRNLVCDVLALRAGYQKASGVQVTLSADGPAIAVHADGDQLKQVLLNLLVNAEDALKDRAVRRVALKVSRVGGIALVFIDDSGSGVPEPLRQRIFEPFFTTKPEGQGTGLGLSVSYGIVREHGGNIWVEPSPLGGARFVVQLPARAGCSEDTPPKRTSDPARGGKAQRVLVVDDEEPIRLVAQRILSRFGHTVEIAANGRQGLELVRAQPFDVIICDLRMPEMSGADFHAALLAEGLLDDVAFAVATGDIADAAAFDFVQSAELRVLLKPFELVDLLDLVNEPHALAA